MNIEISQEDYEFLKDLQNELNTQENDGNADPVFWGVEETVEECRGEDGKWEVVVDSTDTNPYGVFWLRSKETFTTPEKMMESVSRLIENIKYWFKDEFDNYFLGQQHIDNTKPHWVDIKDLPSYGINVVAAYKYNDWEDGIWLYELCYWNGNKFENRTGKGKILKWIPQADIDKIIEDYE